MTVGLAEWIIDDTSLVIIYIGTNVIYFLVIKFLSSERSLSTGIALINNRYVMRKVKEEEKQEENENSNSY